GITFVYITHDQEEAINMSDRIVVMNEGRFEQIGTPAEIYDHPRTAFVAGFIGTANLFSGTVTALEGDRATVALAGSGTVTVGCANANLTPGQPLSFSVRSENLSAGTQQTEGFCLAATVAENNYVGGMLRIVFRLADGREIYSTRHGIHRKVSLGDTVYLSWDPDNAALVDLGG
ncbi:MAG: TOBE domain-containing protein, partial [Angelakisella sp.]